MKIFKKGDFVIIIIIIIISIIPIIFLKKEFKGENSNIVVTQDSKIIGRYELNKSNEAKHIDFEFEMNGKKYIGTLETQNSKVRLLRLPEEVIPKSIHADMSWIEDDTKIIVALPAKLVVSIENSNKESEIDSIST